ncbi:MAG: OmpA family protein [Treponema sp.]|jgi:outer membrane protein OmpA-like peptidoglycan-associated protein|nr:OmpA family protein [Treponema sp.]
MNKFYPPLLYLLFLLFLASALHAETFAYKQKAGDKYRILSTVREDVYVNRRFSHGAEIVNRIAVETTSADNGRASIKAVFQTGERTVHGKTSAEQAAGSTRAIDPYQGGYQWQKDYMSEFERDRLGYISIDKRYFMPVVRNVPAFPDKDLAIGDTWAIEGHETHDFRDSFGIAEPYSIPFTAHYTYLGEKEWKDKKYPAFFVSYRIFLEPEAVDSGLYPIRITGASDQLVYWNRDIGHEIAYNENFRIIFELSDGKTIEFRGTAEAEIVEAQEMDKESIADQIGKDIAEMGIKDARVTIVDDGISISLENIQFQPDSAELLDSEKEKLDKIGAILRRYQDRDILVAGHTAYTGSEASMVKLSEERASVVADYFINRGVRTPDRVVIQGHGGRYPIADNNNEEGRIRNRRVEITLLEN